MDEKLFTFEDLKAVPAQTIFAKGEVVDSPEGLNITNSGKMLKWVAVRGVIYDWAVYCHYADKDYEWVKDNGDKVFREENIRKLVPCTDEVFDLYRY